MKSARVYTRYGAGYLGVFYIFKLTVSKVVLVEDLNIYRRKAPACHNKRAYIGVVIAEDTLFCFDGAQTLIVGLLHYLKKGVVARVVHNDLAEVVHESA